MAYTKTKIFRFALTRSVTASNGSVTTVTRTQPPNYDNFFTGDYNPRWRSQVKRRVNATTAYNAAESLIAVGAPANVRVDRTSTGQKPHTMLKGFQFDFDSNPHLMAPGGLASSLNNRALAAFNNKCLKAQRSVCGGTVIGELRETIQMLRTPAKSLRRLVDRYWSDVQKRARRTAARRNVKLADVAPGSSVKREVDKTIAGTYLEAVFGWRPLFNDIKSVAEALTNYDPNPTEQVRVTIKEEYFRNRGKFSFGSGGISEYSFYVREVGMIGIRYQGAVFVTAPYLKGHNTLSRFGFDPIRDFVPTLWELIPYSFLVDYFTNVGDLIQNASFLRSNLAWACKTQRDESRMTPQQYAFRTAGADFPLVSSVPERWVFGRKTVSRSVATNDMSLEFSLPGATSQWLNIAALADLRRPKF